MEASIEGQATQLLVTLNDAIKLGMDKLPWAAERAISAIGFYHLGLGLSYLALGLIALLAGFHFSMASARNASAAQEHYWKPSTSGKDPSGNASFNWGASCIIWAIVALSGVVLTFFAINDIAIAVNPLGWLLSRAL